MNLFSLFVFLIPCYLYSNEFPAVPTTPFNMNAVTGALIAADQEQTKKSETRYLRSPRKRITLFSPYGDGAEWRKESALQQRLNAMKGSSHKPVTVPAIIQIKEIPNPEAPCSIDEVIAHLAL